VGSTSDQLIKPRGPWRTLDTVEIATAEWVDWFNDRRLYASCRTSHQPMPTITTTLNTQPTAEASHQ
jgi:hypothetical protein